MITWPSRDGFVLPTRAYLLSVMEQTIPARRVALADSVAHLHQATASDDRGWAGMAFLGVISDAMQLLEDLAYLGEGFTKQRFEALPFYLGAVTYDGRAPTRFYQRRRSHEDLLVLSGLSVREPASGETLGLLDLFVSVEDATRAAWEEAATATVHSIREMLAELSATWERFGEYFHAFKHGGLVANREDYELLDDIGDPTDPAIAVWLRKKDEPLPHGSDGDEEVLRRVVADLERAAEIAIALIDQITAVRLGAAEYAANNDPPEGPNPVRITVPVRFKLGVQEISESAVTELEAIGVRFNGKT